MSTTTVTVSANLPAHAPRGAALVANVYDLLAAAGAWLRARNEHNRRVREAAAVRRLASSLRDSDPGFAADLLAAADRHFEARG